MSVRLVHSGFAITLVVDESQVEFWQARGYQRETMKAPVTSSRKKQAK